MKNNFLIAIRLTLLCMVLFCGIYTLAVWAISKVVPTQMSFVKSKEGYYENIGQRFTSDNYFYSRPSAVAYNASASGGSNKGPSNPDYLNEVQARIDTFLVHNPTIIKSQIPSDIVTASGSGLDPNISVDAARIQGARIAHLRNLMEKDLQLIVNQQIEKPLFGLFGTEKINVLKLNLALDNFADTNN